MTRKPSYRFVGHTEPWEEKKLSDGISKIGDGIHGTPVYSEDGDCYFINGNNLVDGKIFLFPETKKVQSNQLTVSDTSLKKNTILMSINGTIGSLAWYRDEKVMLGKSVAYLTTEEFDRKFIYSILQTPKIVKHFNNNLTGTTIKNLGLKTIRETVISLPSLPEQTAIGSFFQDIDQLIILQQRKLEVLKEQKKTYLKLLFPAKGQTKPALRFAGFEDKWKEVKLGDLILRGGSGGTPKSTVAKYYGGDIPFLSITDISNSGKYLKKTEKTITNEGLQNSSAWVVPEGAISLAMYASVGKLAILGIDCATSQAFYNMIFEDDIVRNFVYITLEKANIYNEWGSLISTGTQANLNAEKVKNFSFRHPSSSEQEAIGSFFQDLDKAITKQEEKVNQLKESKQTLLRKMFI